MTDKEIILLFKEDSGMTEKQWRRFSKRYASRNVFTVIAYIREKGVKERYSLSKTFEDSLRAELRSCAV